MNNAGVPCSIYTATKDLFDHPQITERRAFKQMQDHDGPFKIQNPPFQFAGSDTATADSVPELGEHTLEVLTQFLGYDAGRNNYAAVACPSVHATKPKLTIEETQP